jgi:hypothetical protein
LNDSVVRDHEKEGQVSNKRDTGCERDGEPESGVLKHMLHKAEVWGYLEISPGRRVENLRDDGAVRTAYYTEEQLKLLVTTAAERAVRIL